ncbi:transferase [[Flexibacter] sp. ATCC 35103]|uniref:acyltransferase n=1 Tax=[Flexibacter] sp. ATCC 35103 TaxID=1937528 RepID=UPI0009D3965B|nr:transferase [[Flexibacter] sp. ATCC 35103]OMQ08828.1 transferase [[Flexibacter] sp. ATCC 35103]
MYNKLRLVYHRFKFYYSVNWTKTLYFNFKKFPFDVAKKLPVYFYGKVKFTSIAGKIEINAPIRKGMIGFGQAYEMNTIHKGTAEINITGTLVFKGSVQFGKDYFVIVKTNGYCEFGHMSSLASNGKLICTDKIILGDYARLGSECQLIDTNFHQMIDTQTGEVYKMSSPIQIGNYNFISNRVSIMKGTVTPNFCTIASNSVCTKDYSSFGENVLIGGIPVKLIKNNISRDWQGEKENLNRWLIV